MTNRRHLAIVGAGCWALMLLIAGVSWWMMPPEPQLSNKVGDYFLRPRRTVNVWLDQPRFMTIGDPIFAQTGDTTRLVGVVAEIDDEQNLESRRGVRANFRGGVVTRAKLTLYGSAPALQAGDYFERHATDQSMGWVIQTMMSPEMKTKIGNLIINSFDRNRDVLVAAFEPVVKESISAATVILREDLEKSFDRHQKEIDQLSERFQNELLQEQILPLVQDEIWPVVQEESQPLATTIGREIWREVSVWRFGWRYLYDKSPLPDRKLSEQEFERFVDDKAIPILKEHVDDFVGLQQRLLTRISTNEKVKATVSAALREVATDPEVRDLVSVIFREVVTDNDRLKNTLESKWKTDAGRRAIWMANNRLDPTVRRIGETMFGSPETEITPEFARVLRNRVMHKDARWLTLHSAALENRDESKVAAIEKVHREDGIDSDDQPRNDEWPVVIATTITNIPTVAAEPTLE